MLGEVGGPRRLRRLAIATALTAGCGGAAHVTSDNNADAGAGPTTAPTGSATTPAPSSGSVVTGSPSEGPPDAAPDASRGAACIGDLTNIGTANFTISFKVQTTQTGLVTLVYQRLICKHSMFWDVRLNPGGTVGVEIDDGHIHYTLLYATTPIDDGAVHSVVVARVAQVVSIVIDGRVEASASALANFITLSPLGSVSGDPCETFDGTKPLTGTLTDLCVAGPR
jgi:hypothetical protein